jgi:hypothetical protein
MKNLVSEISNKSLVKNYGITQAFFIDGELYTTSHYDLPMDVFVEIENELTKI